MYEWEYEGCKSQKCKRQRKTVTKGDVLDHLSLDGDDDDAAVGGGGVGSGSLLFFSKALDHVFFCEK